MALLRACFCVGVVLCAVSGVQGIVLRSVGVPMYAVSGRDVVLSCDYDLEGQPLYAVKWYKNGLEFFRYLPSKPVPVTVYARPGVNVAESRSDERQVTLTNVGMKSTGRYRCEVSTEAPSFATDSHFGDMIVVVLPETGPIIIGGKERYSLGDPVNVNCSSGESKPAPDLLWFINGEPADDSLLVRLPVVNTTRDLHTAVLGLSFKASKEHFSARGDMKLKCTAMIGDVYWQSNEKAAEGYKQKRASDVDGDAAKNGNEKDSHPGSAFGLSSVFGRGSTHTPCSLLSLAAVLAFAWATTWPRW